ncbi:unnamed protein product [Miscanthus lutarioriparius]|uniref:Protein kinase domain-containing protein n=1 Tax=Miscanthus lutarioriparius TaxID=422564 RepID=A0A811NU59_9POAL|nr:unnamed protein product [Miscanthus lutarioriparius]
MHLPGCEAAADDQDPSSQVVKGSRKNSGNRPKTHDRIRSYKFVAPSFADTGGRALVGGRREAFPHRQPRAARRNKRTRPFPSSPRSVSARVPRPGAARRNRPPPPPPLARCPDRTIIIPIRFFLQFHPLRLHSGRRKADRIPSNHGHDDDEAAEARAHAGPRRVGRRGVAGLRRGLGRAASRQVGVRRGGRGAAAARGPRPAGPVLAAHRALPGLLPRRGGRRVPALPRVRARRVARRRGRQEERGRLAERDIRAYAGDVARALAYLHGLSLVHGDVKARNVVIGGDGRARLTDFGCARTVSSTRPIGGTPAFMAPEVARGQEQGPAADVWALGCMVIEMATGRAPWSDMDDLLAAIHQIGYTDAVPEVPAWLSAEAKDFLAGCFERHASARSTAAQLVVHPFVASAASDLDAQPAKQQDFPSFPSPKSTLHDAFWDSDTEDDEADDMSTGAAERIGALACAASALPDWDSEEGWIDLQDDRSETVDAPPAATEAAAAVADYFVWAEPSDAAELEHQFAAAADVSVHLHLPPHITGVVVAGATTISQGSYLSMHLGVHEKEIPRPLDHDDDGVEKVESHRACNRNRVTTTMKRISLKKIPSRDHLVGTGARPVHHHVLIPLSLTCEHRTAGKKSISLSTTPLTPPRPTSSRSNSCADGNPSVA